MTQQYTQTNTKTKLYERFSSGILCHIPYLSTLNGSGELNTNPPVCVSLTYASKPLRGASNTVLRVLELE